MHKSLAIRLQDVSKIYKLHGSQGDQLIDVLGLERFGFKTRHPAKEFAALNGISFEAPRGHRIGIIGRNGAGKTTLLKLICGNFAPTQGSVEVNGKVQALMSIGLGFHPEYTGRANVEASLQYNGLARGEYLAAMEGVIDFCELGDFLDQPFKTYSLGMQARLMFAASTAIRPDILIVDEILGAGDAYFIAKSKIRVGKLVNSGCTMLLVSHSMQQVLELCSEAIWLDQGRIRMRSDAFRVVKAYEEFIHGPIKTISIPPVVVKYNPARSDLTTPKPQLSRKRREDGEFMLQEPAFLPHADTPELPPVPDTQAETMRFEAPGGISRWNSEPGLKICGFSIVTEEGVNNTMVAMRPAKIVFFLVSELDGSFDCRYGIAIHDLMGRGVVRIFSPPDAFETKRGETRKIEILLNPNQIGSGEYTLGISVLRNTPLEVLNNATRYDLLGRSFTFTVKLPDSLAALDCAFFHSAEWLFSGLTAAPCSDSPCVEKGLSHDV